MNEHIKHKSIPFTVKALDDDAGTVTLYAAVFGNLDRQGEIIEQGAFANLTDFVKDGWLGLNHDMRALPVASIEVAVQDATGLLLTCRWHSTPEAQAVRTVVRERMERGKAVKCSVGFRVLEGGRETRNGEDVFMIRKAEIFEASIVNLPANPKAEVTSVKGGVITLDQALGLITDLKEGRTLSKANIKTIRDWSARCRKAADEMDAMVESFDKDKSIDVEAAISARRDSLRLRSLRLRSSLNSLN